MELFQHCLHWRPANRPVTGTAWLGRWPGELCTWTFASFTANNVARWRFIISRAGGFYRVCRRLRQVQWVPGDCFGSCGEHDILPSAEHVAPRGYMERHAATWSATRLHGAPRGYMERHAVTWSATRLHGAPRGYMERHAVTWRATLCRGRSNRRYRALPDKPAPAAKYWFCNGKWVNLIAEPDPTKFPTHKSDAHAVPIYHYGSRPRPIDRRLLSYRAVVAVGLWLEPVFFVGRREALGPPGRRVCQKLTENAVGVKKTGKGRRKIGRKKRRMRSKIRHRKK